MGKSRNNFYSPLRYPGGKTRLAPFVKSLLDENDLLGSTYVEPYAGGAGIALSLLFEGHVPKIIINDRDKSIYAFWYNVVYESDSFCDEVEDAPLSVDFWLEQRDIQKNKQKKDSFELGFSTFYLNRTNISGVVKGGLIGGMNQNGTYKMDARFNKEDLIRKIQRIGKHEGDIEVRNKDAFGLLQQSRMKGKFVYLDPPYVKKAKGLYMNFYQEKDHKDIASLLVSGKPNFHWLLSYDQDDLINKLYRKCKTRLEWNTGYGPSNRTSKEHLFLHKSLDATRSKALLS